MTITRILPGVLLVMMATAGPIAAQYGLPSYTPPGRSTTSAVVPSILPTGATEGEMPNSTAPAVESLRQMTTAIPPGTPPPGGSDPVGTLTTAPGQAPLPPGSYASPWYNDSSGCCGPVGRHGSVVYELYTRTGPNLPFGSGAFTDRLHVGWTIAGGGRSLFMNSAGTAAWAIDLGGSYTYNRGSNDDFVNLFIRTPPTISSTGVVTVNPDRLALTRIRALHRTSFNYAVGREWFLWGSGVPGGEEGWNFRVGADVGGRWGTAHVDLVPLDGGPNSYSRRQKVYEGVFLAAHSNLEVPCGGWIFFVGSRVEYGYDWMNIVPPIKGDVQYVNLLLTSGFRF